MLQEQKSRELPREVSRMLLIILRSLAVFSLGVTRNQIFQWQTTTSASLRRSSKLLAFS
jgi:hypothetical protein